MVHSNKPKKVSFFGVQTFFASSVHPTVYTYIILL